MTLSNVKHELSHSHQNRLVAVKEGIVDIVLFLSIDLSLYDLTTAKCKLVKNHAFRMNSYFVGRLNLSCGVLHKSSFRDLKLSVNSW